MLFGPRAKRIMIRAAVFFSMLLLFSLAFGVKAPKQEDPLEDSPELWVVFIGLCLLTGLVYFAKTGTREAERTEQLADEVISLNPEGSITELYEAYARRRSREMRLEAAMY